MASKFLLGFSLPSNLILDSLIQPWLLEDIGRGDRVTQALIVKGSQVKSATWIAKENGIVAGLPIAARVFQLLDPEMEFEVLVKEGAGVMTGETIAKLSGPFEALLTGERVALNLAMRLSGIATATEQFVAQLEGLPTRFADTRKTTPGMRILEKYASQVGGAINHRMGLDDSAMIKDNHIAAAGGIAEAIALVRAQIPYPLTIEVETESLIQVQEAVDHGADIIMLDNMGIPEMREAVQFIRAKSERILIEASGNVTVQGIRAIAETGVDIISSSAPMTRSAWMDLSMRF
jgi:nicotinate-nucleotide pyrophosphorylase (carboxylating)